MPILLIKATSATHWNPEEDLRGCYKRGDVVEVFDDSRYGREEPPGSGTFVVDAAYLAANPITAPFYIVKVVGVSLARAQRLIEPDTDGVDVRGRPIVVRRRRFWLRADDVPVSIRNQLAATRFVQVTATQIQNYITNKRTLVDGIPL